MTSQSKRQQCIEWLALTALRTGCRIQVIG